MSRRISRLRVGACVTTRTGVPYRTLRSAKEAHRPEAAFFARPSHSGQRRYEALRAYFLDGEAAGAVAERFGYTLGAVQSMVRDFRAGDRTFFAERRRGPKTAPAKSAARAEVVRLRRAGHSIEEISTALAATQTPLNRTGVWQILRAEGFERLPQRSLGERGAPNREPAPRARVAEWPTETVRRPTDHAGLFLLVPALVGLDLVGAVKKAGLPGTREIPARSYALSLLALKLLGKRRVSHVDDLTSDPGVSLFSGLESLPKATALGSYSYRLERSHNVALLNALGKSAVRTEQATGQGFDLDFHAIMHYGDDVALETHYVPRRSQRTEAVLTFFAQDNATHNLVYANATCRSSTRAREVVEFARHWKRVTRRLPELLVFDSKVTTGAGLAELDALGVRFLTIRQRSPRIMRDLEALPRSAWSRISLDRSGDYSHPEVHEDSVQVRGCSRPLRQIAVRGLGHLHPTLILTNDSRLRAAALVDRYAKRMTIEQRLAESIRSFHLDALSSAVALNVDFDTTLMCWAQNAYDWLRRRLEGYATATPDTIWRRFVSTRGAVAVGPKQVVVTLDRRTYSPVVRSADLPDTPVPWWGGRLLRFEFA